MRMVMNQALSALTSYLRSISRALTPFFDALISKMTSTHVRTAIFDPCMTVPVSTAELLPAGGALPYTAWGVRSGAGHWHG